MGPPSSVIHNLSCFDSSPLNNPWVNWQRNPHSYVDVLKHSNTSVFIGSNTTVSKLKGFHAYYGHSFFYFKERHDDFDW